MKHPFGKYPVWFALAACFLLCLAAPDLSYAEEQDDSDYDNLSFYVDNPDYRIEDGLAIEIATNTLKMARSDVRSVTIPKGVQTIGFNAFVECSLLESVVIPEGVRVIESGAFYDCELLTSITLPTTLEEIEHYALSDCDLDTLIIPRNTRLEPILGQSEWYGVLDACKIKTLVFCGTDGLFLPTTFGNIVFPADGSGRIVFWGDPPKYIEVLDLQFNYKGGDVDSGPFTICYPAQYANTWAPNGETEWNGLPICALTKAEERQIRQNAPKLFSDEDRTDVTQYPGWSFDQNHNVTIYSEEGWYRYCIKNWGMEINDLRFAEGVDYLLEYFNPTSGEGMYPGPSEITMKRLILPESLVRLEMDHIITQEVIVAEGNTCFRVEDGKLISINEDTVIWPTNPDECGNPDANASMAEIVPTPTFAEALTATSETEQTREASTDSLTDAEITTSGVLLVGLIVLALAAVVVVGVQRKRTGRKPNSDRENKS